MSTDDHSPTDSHIEEWAALLGTDLDRSRADTGDVDCLEDEAT
ncbi:hypothetical protein ACFQL1_10575 [Halomicroarcula sp. GCM10025709]|nr:hypothetical protein [Halomicroarcula sp. YJ-61-S]